MSKLSGNKDLKSTCCACYSFWRLARVRLWHKPLFQHYMVSRKDMQQLAQLNPPIKQMSLKQFAGCLYEQSGTVRWKRIVDYILKHFPRLSTFSLDYRAELTVSDCEQIFRLPVTHVYTGCFSSHTPIHEVVQTLTEAKLKPVIYIDPILHLRLNDRDLERLCRLRIVGIAAQFSAGIDLSSKAMDRYDQLVASIQPAPDFTVVYFEEHSGHPVTPELLSSFKRTRITTLDISDMDLTRPINDFVTALEKCNQRPVISLADTHVYDFRPFIQLSADDLKLLFRYPVSHLSTSVLQFDLESADELIGMIIELNNRSPITSGLIINQMFYRDEFRRRTRSTFNFSRVFNKRRLRRIKAAGIKIEDNSSESMFIA